MGFFERVLVRNARFGFCKTCSKRSNAMHLERRQEPRRSVQFPAWVSPRPGRPMQACMIYDASDIGARIVLDDLVHLPDEFVLMFTPDGAISRACKVVWRSQLQAGIRFTAPLDDPTTLPRAPWKS